MLRLCLHYDCYYCSADGPLGGGVDDDDMAKLVACGTSGSPLISSSGVINLSECVCPQYVACVGRVRRTWPRPHVAVVSTRGGGVSLRGAADVSPDVSSLAGGQPGSQPPSLNTPAASHPRCCRRSRHPTQQTL